MRASCRIETDEELKYIHWSIQLCRSRHLEFTEATLTSLLGAFQRVSGSTEKLAELLVEAPSKRLFLNYAHWAQAVDTCLSESDVDSAAKVADAMVEHQKLPPTEAEVTAVIDSLLQAQALEPAARTLVALESKFPSSASSACMVSLLQQLGTAEVDSLAAAEEAATAAEEDGGDEDQAAAVWVALGAHLRGLPTDALQGELGSARQAVFERYPIVLGGLAPAGADDSAGDDGAPAATLDAEEAAQEAAEKA